MALKSKKYLISIFFGITIIVLTIVSYFIFGFGEKIGDFFADNDLSTKAVSKNVLINLIKPNDNLPVLDSYDDLLNLQVKELPGFRGGVGVPENFHTLYGFVPTDSLIQSADGLEMIVPKGWMVGIYGPYLDFNGLQSCTVEGQRCAEIRMTIVEDSLNAEETKDYDSILVKIKNPSIKIETSETLVPNARVIKEIYESTLAGMSFASIRYHIFFNYLTTQKNSRLNVNMTTVDPDDIKKVEEALSTLKITDVNDKKARDLARLRDIDSVVREINNPAQGRSLWDSAKEYPKSLLYLRADFSARYPSTFAYAYHSMMKDGKEFMDGYHIGVNLEDRDNMMLQLDDCGDRNRFTCPDISGYGSKYFSGADDKGCLGEEGFYCFDLTFTREWVDKDDDGTIRYQPFMRQSSSFDNYDRAGLFSNKVFESLPDIKKKRLNLENILFPLVRKSQSEVEIGEAALLKSRDLSGQEKYLIKTSMNGLKPVVCIDALKGRAIGGVGGGEICDPKLSTATWPTLSVCGSEDADTRWIVESGDSLQFQFTLECKRYTACNGKENAFCTKDGCQFPASGTCK